jgi:hypothetical protein
LRRLAENSPFTGRLLGVSMERYTSSDMEQKREAVRKLDAALRPKA